MKKSVLKSGDTQILKGQQWGFLDLALPEACMLILLPKPFPYVLQSIHWRFLSLVSTKICALSVFLSWDDREEVWRKIRKSDKLASSFYDPWAPRRVSCFHTRPLRDSSHSFPVGPQAQIFLEAGPVLWVISDG